MIDRPELLVGLDVYFFAYQDLLSERQIGMGVGPIPWHCIHAWAVVNGITDLDEIDVLIHHVRALESADREFEENNPKPKATPK